ncbi:hypothetical protein [Phenylobacterium sp.]|uniref:hypothetical protein n=1 Tax=Phenylobacterium sp. TaxID=1871053 RepID=UPI00286B166E|nr:hypothetical protein [Phenylobacterium sp.]
MTASIDPANRPRRVRRPRTSAADLIDEIEARNPAAGSGLPVPVAPARSIPPKTPIASAATIEAQLEGERRGLRAGASAINQAKAIYNKTNWSGAKDRRAPKGRTAKTDV